MPSPMQRIQDFLKSPRGRELTDRARTYARDPKNRDRARQALDRFRGSGGSRGPRP